MNSYRYRVTVQKIADAKGEPVKGESMSFEAVNHDDILAIAERATSRMTFDADLARQMAIGLKLFAEVALIRKDDPMFANIRPAIRDFIMQLKQTPEKEKAGVGGLL
ncbi:MAG: DUF3861 domain-containing protein [Edaphobacter sp.]|uniref:DUF3861 domain-containing protein n=1 Tax=Edaphobacter sp. TaxID=1934404 RepID=UPI00238BA1AB|nr:DUF3861 domain-containing protein [Edaphobacter sp.]MDE1176220.1 DUF3861 domain-containing protein [Edaphobacter sp.]